MSERSNKSFDGKSDGSPKKSVQKKQNADKPKESLEERMTRKMAAMEAGKKPASSTTPASPKQESLEERMARKMAAMEGNKSPSSAASQPSAETREEKFARKVKAMEKDAKAPSKIESKEERFARKMAEDETARGEKKETKEERFARKMSEDEAARGAKKDTKEESFVRKMAQVKKETQEERFARKMAEDEAAIGAMKGLPEIFVAKEVLKETKEERFARKMKEDEKTRGVKGETKEDRLARKMKEFGASDTSREVRKSLHEEEARREAAAVIATTGAPPNQEPEQEEELLASDEGPGEYNEPNIEHRSTGSTSKLDQKTRRASEDGTYVPGAYHVGSRAMGALPAWAPSRHRSETAEDENEDLHELPPELRNVSEAPLQMPPTLDADSGANQPSELQAGGGASDWLVLDVLIPGEELPAEVAEVAAVTAWSDTASKQRSGSKRRWIIIGVAVAAALAIAVGVGIALSSGGDDGGDTGGGTVVDQCDFTDIEQPSVLLQCQCNQEITKWSEDVYARYQDLVTTVIPEVKPNFAEAENSCANSNVAVAWLATDAYSSSTTDIVTLTNRFVLALLFLTWSGTNWKRNDGWLSSQSECNWYGIACNGTNITGIELGANSLQSGPDDGLPVELYTLTSLKSFNASDASLSGSIQSEIGYLVNLEKLDLGSFQSFLGHYPDELFSLPKLRVLDLSYGTKGGTLPTIIGSAMQLESFVANRANLVGAIPSEIGLMTSLVMLSLDVNALSGTFPAEIGKLLNLEALILSSNKIENEIPTTLGSLSSLVALDLGYNALRGSIPIEVASLPNLRFIRLRENRLTGTVPEEVLVSGKLECFDSSNNLMENYIPQGDCPAETPLLTQCNEVDDPACSCCTCMELGPIDYCKVQVA